MESSFDPRNVIQFTLENDKVVSAKIQEGWSKHVPIESFGVAALLSLTEERVKNQLVNNAPITKLAKLPESVSSELTERARRLLSEAFTLLGEVKKENSAKIDAAPEIEEFTDRYRRVIVKISSGNIAEVQVSERLLRSKPEEAEMSLVEAINNAESSMEKRLSKKLGTLKAEIQEIRAIYSDYERDI